MSRESIENSEQSSEQSMRQRADAFLQKLEERHLNRMITDEISIEHNVSARVVNPTPELFMESIGRRFDYDSHPSNVVERILRILYEDFMKASVANEPYDDPFDKRAATLATQLHYLSDANSRKATDLLFDYYDYLKKQAPYGNRVNTAARKIIGLSGEDVTKG